MMVNARAETVAEQPAYRTAFKARRCLIPADGFYEWQKRGVSEQPFLIRRRDRAPFAFAGLWEQWHDFANEVISCTILTTDANEALWPIHGRMPVILDAAGSALWLARPSFEVLQPCSSEWLEAVPVSCRVNDLRNDDAALLEPLVDGVEG